MTETDFRRVDPTSEEDQLFDAEDQLSVRSMAVVDACGRYATRTGGEYSTEETYVEADQEFRRDLAAELGEMVEELTDDDRAALRDWCEKAEDAAQSVGQRVVVGLLNLRTFYREHARFVRRTVDGD